ncbi:MAG: hypothetical protein JWP41_1907 [Ramlibacter sp.]|nr:hypothetical protein [Ramlibacter sp.]
MRGILQLRHMRVRAQLAIGFGITVLMVVLLVAQTFLGTHEGGLTAEGARINTEATAAAGEARAELGELRTALAEFPAADAARRQQILLQEAGHVSAVRAALQAYAATGPTGQEAGVLARADESFRQYVAARARWFELLGAGQPEAAAQLQRVTLSPPADAATQALRELSRLQHAAGEMHWHRTQDVLVVARRVAAVLAAVAVLSALLLAWRITASIANPIQQAVAAADRIARGDLSVALHAQGHSEAAQLLRSLGVMSDGLRQLASDVAARAQMVAETSSQIAQGNADLSQRTEEQASTLEETAGSMEELTATVAQNAESARKASELAGGASHVAREGAAVMAQVVVTMGGISAASRKVQDIVAVIDGIAFQTNILALNAAVEAARAGDEGRGFAVVASEVRTLAQRSANAAREIRALISDSVAQVEAGVGLVTAAGRTMEGIVGAVQQVSGLVTEIAGASREQSSGIDQVNVAVAQIDQAVQHNASLVEEAAAATESMNEQAASLLRSVARFRLEAGEAPASGPARAGGPRVRARPVLLVEAPVSPA